MPRQSEGSVELRRSPVEPDRILEMAPVVGRLTAEILLERGHGFGSACSDPQPLSCRSVQSLREKTRRNLVDQTEDLVLAALRRKACGAVTTFSGIHEF